MTYIDAWSHLCGQSTISPQQTTSCDDQRVITVSVSNEDLGRIGYDQSMERTPLQVSSPLEQSLPCDEPRSDPLVKNQHISSLAYALPFGQTFLAARIAHANRLKHRPTYM